MPFPPADAYLERLGLTAWPHETYLQTLRRHRQEEAVQEFDRLDVEFRTFGDAETNQAFYRVYYSGIVPELEKTWSEVWTRVFSLDFERKVLPELAHFCLAHERRTRVLVTGCGDGLETCFLAQQCPDMDFTAVDWCAEAVAAARARVQTLGVENVSLAVADAFALPIPAGNFFDAALLRNVVDDTRFAGPVHSTGAFDTKRKLAAIRSLIAPNARVWVSLTPYPADEDPRLVERIEADLRVAGFTATAPLRISYTMAGQQKTHLAWTITPGSAGGVLPIGRSFEDTYVPEYHVPAGQAIPLEDVVLNEQCYINLSGHTAADLDPRCPRPECRSTDVGIMHQGGPARTRVNHYKVWARIFCCNTCRYGYAVAEVID